MTQAALTKELIADPTLWRLILRLDARRMSALLLGPESVERSVIYHSEDLCDSSVKSLENAVYDNPLLLGDFAKVDILFSTPELFTAPSETEDLREAMADAMLPDCIVDRRVHADSFGEGDVCYVVPADIYNFASRTFANARFHHSLAIDTLYLKHRNSAASDSAHLFALCEGRGELAIVAFDDFGRVNFVNRPQPLDATDFAYYILAAAADSVAPISVGGEPELRNAVCDVIRDVRPNAKVLPLTLHEDLLRLRRFAPEATFDMLFLTQL